MLLNQLGTQRQRPRDKKAGQPGPAPSPSGVWESAELGLGRGWAGPGPQETPAGWPGGGGAAVPGLSADASIISGHAPRHLATSRGRPAGNQDKDRPRSSSCSCPLGIQRAAIPRPREWPASEASPPTRSGPVPLERGGHCQGRSISPVSQVPRAGSHAACGTRARGCHSPSTLQDVPPRRSPRGTLPAHPPRGAASASPVNNELFLPQKRICVSPPLSLEFSVQASYIQKWLRHIPESGRSQPC